MKHFKSLFSLVAFIFVFGVSALVTYSVHSNSENGTYSHSEFVQDRAARLFKLDSQKKALLSQNQLVALSIALKFKDITGAEKLVERLERQARN